MDKGKKPGSLPVYKCKVCSKELKSIDAMYDHAKIAHKLSKVKYDAYVPLSNTNTKKNQNDQEKLKAEQSKIKNDQEKAKATAKAELKILEKTDEKLTNSEVKTDKYWNPGKEIQKFDGVPGLPNQNVQQGVAFNTGQQYTEEIVNDNIVSMDKLIEDQSKKFDDTQFMEVAKEAKKSVFPPMMSVGKIEKKESWERPTSYSIFCDKSKFITRYDYFDKLDEVYSQTGKEEIKDYIRRLSGYYWTKVEKDYCLLSSNNDLDALRKIEIYFDIPYEIVSESLVNNSNQTSLIDKDLTEEAILLKPIKEKYSLQGGVNSSIFSQELWVLDATMLWLTREKEYFNYSMNIPIPYTTDDLSCYESYSHRIADAETCYNYYHESYEKAIASQEVEEYSLPNFYTYLLSNEEKKEIPEKYCDLFSNKVKDSDITDGYKTIVFSSKNIIKLIGKNEFSSLFPMNMKVKFTTDKSTIFSDLFKESGLSDSLSFYLINQIDKTNPDIDMYDISTGIVCSETNEKFSSSVSKGKYRVFSLETWMNNLISTGDVSLDVNIEFDEGIFLNTVEENKESVGRGEEFNLYKSFMTMIFFGKLKDYTRKYYRTFREMLEGKTAYSETILYRIEKSVNGVKHQNIYVPNCSELDVFEYIDTQVKYGKKYSYKVFAYQMVMGTSYSYEKSIFDEETSNIKVLVKHKPAFRIIEVPYFEEENYMFDFPPISPNIEIVPYGKVDNKVLINLSNNVGQIEQYPIILTSDPKDLEFISKIAKSQKRKTEDKLIYASDDIPILYEIFRLDEKPKSYFDFIDKKYITLSSIINGTKCSSVSTEDTIEPNKKYYYIFRVKDEHENYSNPSPVYEVEIFKQEGIVLPRIKVVDFDSEKNKVLSKSFRRYLQIVPSFEQTFINEVDKETVKDEVEVKLGRQDKSVFGQDFKIRITSKKTGKVLEFDFGVDKSFNNETLKK
ncbi:hypothetical protein M0R19_04355 [Candidatus Pacearchaeota archaeon]|nr:hypothetical protein [Candidatus Pacearchaeota archaeon]